MAAFMGTSIRSRGRSIGNLYVSRREGREPFSAEEQQAIELLATNAGSAIENVRLYQALEATRARLQVLSDASLAMSGSIDPGAVAESIGAALVPPLADGCFVDVVDEGGRVRRVAVALAGLAPGAEERVRGALLRCPPRLDDDHAVARTLRDGCSRCSPPGSLEVPPEAEAAGLSIRLVMVVPLVARRRVLGALTLIAQRREPFSEHDLELAEQLGQRAALCLDNAQLHSEAKRAVAARDELLAVVSHDLKNPLSAILLACSLLDRAATPEQQRSLAKVRRAAQMMTELIHTQLDMLTIESRRFSVDVAPHRLQPIITDVIGLLALAASSRGVALEQPSPTDATVLCDPARIAQVLSNLIGNAIKFTPPGGRVEVRCAPEGAAVVVTVRDTGPGIPKDELPHLFDRFWRAPGLATRAPGSAFTSPRPSSRRTAAASAPRASSDAGARSRSRSRPPRRRAKSPGRALTRCVMCPRADTPQG